MQCYRLQGDAGAQIERQLRSLGAQLVSTEWTCWVQYYYQQILPAGSGGPSEIPALTVVGVDTLTYLVTEVVEHVKAGTVSVPMTAVDVVEIDSATILGKLKIFSLKNKSVKKIKFTFSRFSINGIEVMLNDDLVMMSGVFDGLVCPADSMIAMGVNRGFLRPRTLETPFWVYQLSKLKERVFPTEVKPVYTEVSECLFAKDLLLA